jgi:protein SCO1/2
VVVGAWIALGAWWTHGYSAFTAFSAAVAAAGPLPRPAPRFVVIDQAGRTIDLGARDGAYRLIQAMYLRCPDICPLAMSRLQRLAAALSDVSPSRLRAVSVSVDRDPPDRLRAVWEAYGSPSNWSFVTPVDGAGDEALLDLGIWLYRRPDGLINHGVDIFVIDPEGRVVGILPANEDLDRLAAAVREIAG